MLCMFESRDFSGSSAIMSQIVSNRRVGQTLNYRNRICLEQEASVNSTYGVMNNENSIFFHVQKRAKTNLYFLTIKITVPHHMTCMLLSSGIVKFVFLLNIIFTRSESICSIFYASSLHFNLVYMHVIFYKNTNGVGAFCRGLDMMML